MWRPTRSYYPSIRNTNLKAIEVAGDESRSNPQRQMTAGKDHGYLVGWCQDPWEYLDPTKIPGILGKIRRSPYPTVVGGIRERRGNHDRAYKDVTSRMHLG